MTKSGFEHNDRTDNKDRSQNEISFDVHSLYQDFKNLPQQSSKDELKMAGLVMEFSAPSANPIGDILKDVGAHSQQHQHQKLDSNKPQEPSLLSAAQSQLKDRKDTGHGQLQENSGLVSNIKYPDGSSRSINYDSSSFPDQIVEKLKNGTEQTWQRTGYASNGLESWQVQTDVPAGNKSHQPAHEKTQRVNADIDVTGDGSLKLLNSKGIQTVFSADGAVSSKYRDVASLNSLIHFEPGTTRGENQQIAHALDNLPTSTFNSLVANQYQIVVKGGGAENNAQANTDFYHKEVDVFEPGGAGIAQAAAHEVYHVQDQAQSIANHYQELTTDPPSTANPEALRLAQEDINHMTSKQYAEFDRDSYYFGNGRQHPVGDGDSFTDKNGRTHGLGDLTAGIVSGYIDGYNGYQSPDGNAIGPELAKLFPELTKFLQQKIGDT